MALTETPPATADAPAAEAAVPEAVVRTQPTLIERLVGSGDHELIGRMFVGFSLLFGAANLVIGGLADLDKASNAKIFLPEVTQRLGGNSLVGLFLCGILPLFVGIAICVVPRQVGSAAIAFHRAASGAFWLWFGASVLFIIAVAANGSYFGGNNKMARLGNVATGGLMVGILVASVCIAVTVLSLRPAGMRLDRVPFFSFSMLVASTLWILTLPAAFAHVLIAQIDHANADSLVVSSKVGPSAFAGMSWLFMQPAVYVVFIPVLGVLADVVATAVGGRQRFRGLVLGLIGGFGFLSFGAWAQNNAGRSTFILAGFALAAALPIVGVLGASGDTLSRGRPKLMSPLVFSVFAVLIALLGAGVGILQVINMAGKGNLGSFRLADLWFSQYRLVVGAAIVGALGALFYWGKQIFGSPLPDLAGKGLAPLAALGAAAWGVPYLISGLAKGSSVRPMAGVAGAGALLTAVVVLAVLAAGLKSLSESLRGDVLQPDPWGGGGTLEWADAGADQAVVASPYPVLDAEGAAS